MKRTKLSELRGFIKRMIAEEFRRTDWHPKAGDRVRLRYQPDITGALRDEVPSDEAGFRRAWKVKWDKQPEYFGDVVQLSSIEPAALPTSQSDPKDFPSQPKPEELKSPPEKV